MFIAKLLRFYHTVKYLRWEQVWFRLYYKFNVVKASPFGGAPGHAEFVWGRQGVAEPSMFEGGRVTYLGHDGSVATAACWNDSAKTKLWLYNLHYFDDLNARDFASRSSLHLELIHRWIAENPVPVGNGWEPYPLSLRLVNWVKWCSRETQPDALILSSVLQQSEALSQQLEYHILGNHLFANAKALVFVGAYLRTSESLRLLSLGLSLLDRELQEQFLEDGGHFELSPMYHVILLWDLLELIDLAMRCNDAELKSRLSGWVSTAEKALSWLTVMMHSDGEISFFNDAAIGIAAKPEDVFRYAHDLGLAVDVAVKFGVTTLVESGYSRVEWQSNLIIFDHANVGPDYLPGHAHADSLSLEWSVLGQRVLVNSGTSLYGGSMERLRQRQTPAHNTVVVDGADSSEVWGGFRVARRAYSSLLEVSEGDQKVVVKACHNGYLRLPGKVLHTRSIVSTDAELVVGDELSGSYGSAYAHFHFHPDIAVSEDVGKVVLCLPCGATIAVSSVNEMKLEQASWHPEFGRSVVSTKLLVALVGSKSSVKFSLCAEYSS